MTTQKKAAAKKRAPTPRSTAGHQGRFDQLLGDAILGVPKPKRKKKKF